MNITVQITFDLKNTLIVLWFIFSSARIVKIMINAITLIELWE